MKWIYAIFFLVSAQYTFQINSMSGGWGNWRGGWGGVADSLGRALAEKAAKEAAEAVARDAFREALAESIRAQELSGYFARRAAGAAEHAIETTLEGSFTKQLRGIVEDLFTKKERDGKVVTAALAKEVDRWVKSVEETNAAYSLASDALKRKAIEDITFAARTTPEGKALVTSINSYYAALQSHKAKEEFLKLWNGVIEAYRKDPVLERDPLFFKEVYSYLLKYLGQWRDQSLMEYHLSGSSLRHSEEQLLQARRDYNAMHFPVSDF